ncbi:NPCBM/NEW2 domain-containing protein [Emticicia sp. SJ17W-69]|uniref:NPCBM/NEW2 domain-containing protein n=1 Tax=Emticicia sp. SJ17W-69 TaxID=3421657 RepID=UPI003EB97676
MRIYSLSFIIILFALGIEFDINAQVTITFPMEKAVFQRNQSNQAKIYIAGNFTSTINTVEARLKNASNDVVVIDWTIISFNPNNGVFSGSLSNVTGGWYKLEVRGKLNASVVGTATLNRVGVGEVFIIAGQSNAQGLEGDHGEVGASDERVVTHNEISWFDSGVNHCDLKFPNYPVLSQIVSSGSTRSYLSKTGFNPWAYGKLGDNLVSRLGVPVAFFNAAAFATSSQNWKESSDGLTTLSHYSGQPYCNTSGVPYNGLRKVLNYYASLFGVRAILWHQGESDNFAGISQSNYISNVNYVINKSRSHFGSNIPWVISKASVFDKNSNGGLGNANSGIINAQYNLANSSNQIFSGPSTDDLLGSNRIDEVHFYGPGLIELANRWNASLSTDFFNASNPIVAKPLPIVSVGCHSITELRLTAPSGYNAYKWVRTDTGNNDYEDVAEATTQIIDRSSGTYRCYLTDAQGNITFTQPVTVQNVANYCSCVGLTSCSGITYLSNSTPCFSSNGWGPIEMDKSNGESGLGDGSSIKIKGITYPKGIGTHANSEIVYHLNNNFGRFISDIGIDDEVSTATEGATVIFKVYKDNTLSYTSGILNKNSATVRVNIDVNNVNELKLAVEDGGDTFFADHADWAGARLHCVDNQAPTAPSSLVESNIGQNCVKLTWNASTDNMEVEKYNIYQDGNLIGSVNAPITTYQVTGLLQLNYYRFSVKAVDYSGNISSESNISEVVTLQNPLIAISKKIINIGQSTSLVAFGCSGGTINWSTGSTANPLVVSPSDTTIYSVTCTVGSCTSIVAKDTVKVIPNCKTSYILINNRDNYGGSGTNLTFSSSQTISATNIISTQANVTYKAAKSITLLPGFQSTSGTVFNAYIAGCVNNARIGSLFESQPADKLKLSPSIEKQD